MDPTIYDYLNKLQVSEVTQSQLSSSAKNTFIDPSNVEFWSGLITVARLIGESRTFAHGLPMYDTGEVIANAIDDGADSTILPTGTEVWQIQNIDLQGCTAALRDVSTGAMSQLTDSTFQSGRLYLSSSIALYFNNGSGSPKTPTVAYYKVSL